MKPEDRCVWPSVRVPNSPCMLLDWLENSTLKGTDAVVLGDIRVFVHRRVLLCAEPDDVPDPLPFLFNVGGASISRDVVDDLGQPILAKRRKHRPTGL